MIGCCVWLLLLGCSTFTSLIVSPLERTIIVSKGITTRSRIVSKGITRPRWHTTLNQFKNSLDNYLREMSINGYSDSHENIGELFAKEYDNVLNENNILPSQSMIEFRNVWVAKINNLVNPINLVATDIGPVIQEGIKAFSSIYGDGVGSVVVQQLTYKVKKIEEAVARLTLENQKLRDHVDQLRKTPGMAIAREAARTLENYVVLEIVTSKTHMRKQCIYDFEDLRRKGKQAQISAHLTEPYQELIGFYKKQGNSIHDITYTKDELFKALTFEDENESEDERANSQKQAKFICDQLEKYATKYKRTFGESPLK